MKLNSSWQLRLAQILLGVGLVFALVFVSGTNAQNGPVHSVNDWSHRHLIFSTPSSLAGRIQLSSNPRYAQQQLRRNAEKKFSSASVSAPVKGDWSMNMGSGAKVGAGVFPAKYSFDITTANCATAAQPDFVVYNTGLLGGTTATTAAATGTFSGQTGVITITNPTLGTSLVMSPGLANANTGVGTGTYIKGSNGVEAGNFITAINVAGNGSNVGVVGFSSGGANSILHASTSGAGGDLIQVSATGSFAWITGSTFANGSNGQANIMAFDNLYSGCSGTKPTPYWAYNTAGTVVTSPIISLDGKQVAFIESQAGNIASLVVLKWAQSATDNFNNPTTLSSVAPSTYKACTAPCMTLINFAVTGNPRTDTNSSPFYDFATDTIYVGDNGGRLRRFTGIFNGTPAETTGSGWPVLLTANNITTSAVFDHNSNQVFIADNGGFLYSVTPTVPPSAVVKSGRLGFSLGVVDSPIVDPVAGKIYVYVSNNSATLPATGNSSAVYQIPTSFTAGATGTSVTIGDSSATVKAFAGDFDNIYYSSALGNAGNLYVCGSQTGGVNYIPTLWQIPITGAGALGTPVEGPALATVNNTSCSPVVEVFNSGTASDLEFVSVTNRANSAAPINCPSNAAGCLMSFNVTAGTPISPAGTTTAATLRVTGGASGVIIDNMVGAGTLAGASQVYFSPLANQACTTSGGNTGGCAIQASQAGLN